MRSLFVLGIGLFVVLAGCEDKPAPAKPDAAPPIATATVTAAPAEAAAPAASGAPDAGSEAGARYDPKYKCPTGQTHFYMEGDFCRRKCVTNADCGKRERCSSMDYPFILNGLPAGSSKFCEGT